ncbi:LutC/YkgG family protein [Campylobacter hyointestinalis]|uniref:LutC/YkgG family protein n=1 Tax=Campylobacter hyointestinalis TaxID=198 RepID=UPI000DCE019A|nr:lactate utilization protein C [Campylobacter hyointestinalis]RAZ60376.1 lactate utilization protein C [Campylobacter hyointestinalis subsp. lawsonii]
MSKESILNALKNGFKRSVDNQATPDPSVFIKNIDDDLVREFIQRAEANKTIIINSNQENLSKDINEIIKNENAKNLIYPVSLKDLANDLKIEQKFAFESEIESFKERIFEYDISIIRARGGVSSHGVTCVSSSDNPRLLSLTPRVCVAILSKDDIVYSLSNQLNKIKNEDGRLPTNTIFISGPSRTSDIELQLVLGVHGSQVFYVVLI